MKLAVRVAAFLCGLAAVVGAHALLTSAAAQETAGNETIDVWVGGSGGMRLDEPGLVPAPGERRVRLRGPEGEPTCEPLPPEDLTGIRERLAELEGRDGSPLASRAIAPFEVVNDAGIRVFHLEQPSGAPELVWTGIYNESGGRVGVVATNPEGAAVSMLSASGGSTSDLSGRLAVMIRARSDAVGLSTQLGADTRIAVGRHESGRYSLLVTGPQKTVVAGIGESQAHSGLIFVGSADGSRQVSMFRDHVSGSGLLHITNASQTVASLSSERGAGLLRLMNRAGEVMVEAGMLESGVGVVRAGPGGFQHGLMFLGLPASYIEGTKQ